MNNLALFLNNAKMDVAEEILDIIPGWAFGVHSVWEDGQFFNLFFSHILADISFHEADDHECNKIEKSDGFDSFCFFKKNRSYI